MRIRLKIDTIFVWLNSGCLYQNVTTTVIWFKCFICQIVTEIILRTYKIQIEEIFALSFYYMHVQIVFDRPMLYSTGHK